MQFSSIGIRSRLLALIVVSLTPIIAFSLFLANERQRDEYQQAQQQVRLVAQMIASSHEDIIEQSRQLLAALVLGNDGSHDALMSEQCSRYLQQVMGQHSLYKQMVMARPDGHVYCSAKPIFAPVELAERDFFKIALERKSSAHSGITSNPLVDSKAIVFAEPMLDPSGQVIAVAVSALGLDWMQERFQRAGLPKAASAGLVDANGVVLAGFPGGQFTGRTIVDPDVFRSALEKSDIGLVESKGLDGTERTVAYARLTELPGDRVYIRIGFPKADIEQVAVHTLREMLVGLAMVMVVAIGGGWFGGKLFILRPLAFLTIAANRLGKGDLSARTGLAHDGNEIGQLATTFDHLATHVQRTTRAFQALSAGNRLILREHDEVRLLHEMCIVATEKGDYSLALVSYVEDASTRPLKTMAFSGDDDGFIELAKAAMRQDPTAGRSLEVQVARAGRRRIMGSIATHEDAVAWRSFALERGYRSAAAFPLIVKKEVIGTFTLFAPRDEAFDEDELDLLDEMAADLSFGIAGIRDRQQLETAERNAERAAKYDKLTDLPNAATFMTLLAQELLLAHVAHEPLAVLVVHLARLQEIYDSLGYDPGNAIVREIAHRLHAGPEDDAAETYGRLGLEDFAFFCRDCDVDSMEQVAQAVLLKFQVPVSIGNAQFEIQAAVGASYSPAQGDTPDLLVRRATLAAREAAHRGVPYFLYRGTTERENPLRLQMAADLRRAIERRELTLHFQPKLDLGTGAIVGCEALVRWRHPVSGMVPPAQFVPLAEQTGLIRELTYLVLENAIRQQHEWMAADRRLPIAVNLSVRNLYDTQLAERIDALLETWKVPHELIEFEITESALMEEPEMARSVIARLRAKGSKIYIDDFGTGYSSLSYLVSLPAHALKIDRAFVVQMNKSREAKSVVASIISMAHGLDLMVVAEGVETLAELDLLREMHCDTVQGYYIGHPLPAEEFYARIWPAKENAT